MSSPCEKVKSRSGIIVEARSGDNSGSICTIGTRTDIIHIVTVKNLKVYPADIKCQGKILSQNPKAKFSANNISVTDQIWNDAKDDLDDSEEYTFDQVNILSKTSGKKEKIDAEITIDWPKGACADTVTVSIDVNT
jgi:hypothetical protein